MKYNNSWEVAEWSICWELIGLDQTKDDSDFDEIDERRIERELSVEEKNAKNDIDWEGEAKRYRKMAEDMIKRL